MAATSTPTSVNTSALPRCGFVAGGFCCIRIESAASCGLDGGFAPSCGRLGGFEPAAPRSNGLLLGVDCGPDDVVFAGCVLVRWIEGSDGTLGLLPDWFICGWLARDFTFALPEGSEPRAPMSCIAPLILTGSASLRWIDRNAKYESGMSSKSMTRSHSSQRHVGGSCCGGPMSLASTSNTFSSSHSGQKLGT